MNRFISKKIRYILILLTAAAVCTLPVYAQFIKFDRSFDRDAAGDSEDKKEQTRSYPDTIAYNLSVAADPDRINTVIITWDVNPESGFEFIVIRLNEKIDTAVKARKAAVIEPIFYAGLNRIIDVNLRDGSYYYAVVAKEALSKDMTELYPGVNYTVMPVVFADGVSQQLFDSLISTEVKGNEVILRWTPQKHETPIDGFAIYRHSRPIDSYEVLMNSVHLSSVAGDARVFSDKGLAPGEYYYAVITRYSGGKVDVEMKPGLNYTGNASIVRPDIIKTENIDGYDTTSKSQKRTAVPRQAGGIDRIINDTFFKGRYNQAIEELSSAALRSSDRRDRAKALLFIGRSYIELKRYDMAVEHLVREDVTRFFPDEAGFWRDFALRRLK